MRQALATWSLRAVVEALMSLRGVSLITAMTVLSELGDLTRFDSPRQLMSFLGLVPSEHSSGERRRQGAITKTGNGHVRRVLVEAAWSYRYPARKTRHLRRKVAAAAPEIQALAWAAQKRLCARYRHLNYAGKAKGNVTVAVARELGGFIWAIACEVKSVALFPADRGAELDCEVVQIELRALPLRRSHQWGGSDSAHGPGAMRRSFSAPGIDDLRSGGPEVGHVSRDHGHPVHEGRGGDQRVPFGPWVGHMQPGAP